MSPPRPQEVLVGQVLVAAVPGAVERAQAVGIADGRVVAVGTRREIVEAAAPGARVTDHGQAAIIPGLHDSHIHLAGLARTRMAVGLDGARDGREMVERVRSHASRLAPDAWVTGRGWSEAHMAGIDPSELEAAVGERPAILGSHDGHSAWASRAARRLAGISAPTVDPAGGRIERDSHGDPTGVLRETAIDLLTAVEPAAQGDVLRPALDATLRELAAHGITGVTEAGDYTAEGGIGADADLGDSYSAITDLAGLVDGRLRMSLGIPVAAIRAATERGLRTGGALPGMRTLRFGWAKEYSDGALGSGTAALFEPSSCGTRDTGILRVTPDGLDAIFAAARPAGIGLAIHAIGDRAAAAVLDAAERAPAPLPGTPSDRMEHAQLIRDRERRRLARLGMTGSIQPIHAAADRDLVERCWDGRQADAYAWRSLRDASVLLAAGSDAPVESVDPWLGVFAGLHRRLPSDEREDWRPDQALTAPELLAAYTLGPAAAIGAADEGHLRIGARADLAVLDISLEAILAGEVERGVRSVLTVVDGAPSLVA